MKTLILSGLLLYSLNILAQGTVDGFMNGKGKTVLALSFSFETADIYFAGEKEISLKRDLASSGIFASHGINTKVDIIGSIPVINGSLQDAGIFVRYMALKTKNENPVLSVIPSVGITTPLSDYPTELSNSIGQQATVLVNRLIIQAKTRSGLFANVIAGYNVSFEPVPSSHVFSFKTGYAERKWYADLWYEKQTGIGGKDYRATGDLAAANFRQLGVSYDKAGAGLFYSFSERFGISVSGGFIWDGRNVGKSNRISSGIVYTFIKQKNPQ